FNEGSSRGEGGGMAKIRLVREAGCNWYAGRKNGKGIAANSLQLASKEKAIRREKRIKEGSKRPGARQGCIYRKQIAGSAFALLLCVLCASARNSSEKNCAQRRKGRRENAPVGIFLVPVALLWYRFAYRSFIRVAVTGDPFCVLSVQARPPGS